jgi:hypothetical protein
VSDRRRLDGPLGCFLLLVVFVLSAFLMVQITNFRHTHAVAGPIPPEFPVLVLTGAPAAVTAAVVYARELPEYLREHPIHSFLVPPGQEQSIQGQLGSLEGFSVRASGDGRQQIVVSAPWNSDVVNIGWYEATATTFVPQKHRVYGDRGSLLEFALGSFGITFAVGAAAAVWQRSRRRT